MNNKIQLGMIEGYKKDTDLNSAHRHKARPIPTPPKYKGFWFPVHRCRQWVFANRYLGGGGDMLSARQFSISAAAFSSPVKRGVLV